MPTNVLGWPTTFPVLEADGVLLRELRPSDAPAMLAYLTDPAVTGTTSTEIRNLRDVEQLIGFYGHAFARHTAIRWAIVSRETNGVVGSCGFTAFQERHHRAEMGYDVAREQWGHGIASTAARTIVAYGFEQLDLNRIEATMMARNERSERVLARLGFQNEGVLREYKFAHGAFTDYVMFSLLKRDWQAAGAG